MLLPQCKIPRAGSGFREEVTRTSALQHVHESRSLGRDTVVAKFAIARLTTCSMPRRDLERSLSEVEVINSFSSLIQNL